MRSAFLLLHNSSEKPRIRNRLQQISLRYKVLRVMKCEHPKTRYSAGVVKRLFLCVHSCADIIFSCTSRTFYGAPRIYRVSPFEISSRSGAGEIQMASVIRTAPPSRDPVHNDSQQSSTYTIIPYTFYILAGHELVKFNTREPISHLLCGVCCVRTARGEISFSCRMRRAVFAVRDSDRH